MRRWIRSLVVALLCLTLCVDTAKACWWLRHRTFTRSGAPAVRYRPLDATVCCVPASDTADVLVDDVLVDDVVIDHDDSTMPVTEIVESEVVLSTGIDALPIEEQVEVSAEATVVADDTDTTQALENPVASQDTVVVHGPTIVVDAAPAAPSAAKAPASVVTAPAGDAPLPTTAQPMPVPPATPAVLPNPVAAQEPLPDLQPATTPTALEPNLFDRYDDEAGSADDEPPLPEGEPLDPQSDDATSEETPAGEEPAPEEPATETATETAPEAAFFVPDEPMRRWTNAAGTHQAQGWLVELHADRVRILKVNGRHTTMARESLSADDRAYVSAIGGRLAAAQQETAAPTATAGL